MIILLYKAVWMLPKGVCVCDVTQFNLLPKRDIITCYSYLAFSIIHGYSLNAGVLEIKRLDWSSTKENHCDEQQSNKAGEDLCPVESPRLWSVIYTRQSRDYPVVFEIYGCPFRLSWALTNCQSFRFAWRRECYALVPKFQLATVIYLECHLMNLN